MDSRGRTAQLARYKGRNAGQLLILLSPASPLSPQVAYNMPSKSALFKLFVALMAVTPSLAMPMVERDNDKA